MIEGTGIDFIEKIDMETLEFYNEDYVPAKKSTKEDLDVFFTKDADSLLWIWDEDPNRMKEIERINEELLAKYPEKYRAFRNEILMELQPQLQLAFEREKETYIKNLGEVFEKKLEQKTKTMLSSMEQNMEDEVKKTNEKELKYAERRKDAECKRAYAKIKNEIISAKTEGKKICLQCGKSDVSFGCECKQAFYCEKSCFKKHVWIHAKYCRATKKK